MSTDRTTKPSRSSSDPTLRYFTREQANRSLVLVRRIVEQIQEQYELLTRVRAADELPTAEKHLQFQSIAERINVLLEELRDIGCELKDPRAGLVDFPAQMDGRNVWLCWKAGEPAIDHWHEWEEGFAGRRTLETDQG